jgi:transcription termination/antitermination protein NusA
MDIKKLPKTEFAAAVAQIAGERGIDPQNVVNAVELALIAAYKRDAKDRELEIDEEQEFEVTLDSYTGEFKVYQVDGEDKKDVTPPGFGRIAAQTAKQVILQHIRESEKDTIIAEYQERLGTVLNGTILRLDAYKVTVGIGKAEAIMPRSEQVRQEEYHQSQKMAFLLKEIKTDEETARRDIIISRADPQLIIELFKREVPEVSAGTVEIKKIARLPGDRTKIAVASAQAGVDPVGSCVGQKGIRVQSVLKELPPEEKVDIIPFSADFETFVAQSLSPAEGAKVVEKGKIETIVSVPEDQLALAIGEGGDNVRLASLLTETEIKVVAQEPKLKTKKPKEKKTVKKVKKNED